MSNEIKIDIQRTGFPVKVGKVELWFDSSLENLKTFFSIDEVVNETMKEVQKGVGELHFPEDIETAYTPEKGKEADESAGRLIDLGKEQVALEYDLVFGNGTFKKLYEVYPDFVALEKAKEPLLIAIAEKIKDMEKEREKGFEAMKQDALQQKQKKKK